VTHNSGKNREECKKETKNKRNKEVKEKRGVKKG
jgi:hypothetical protein